MSDGITLDTREFNAQVRNLAAITARELKEELFVQARGIFKEIFRVTPPASGTGAAAAKKAGQRSIDRNLNRLFRPVPIKGHRLITHLFGDPNPDVKNPPPYVVQTVEKHPNVDAIYLAAARQAKRGRQFKLPYRRLPADVKKVNRLGRELKRRVGWLGAGFAPAAEKVGLKAPAYIRRHKGRAPGWVKISEGKRGIRIVFVNDVRYADQIDGLRRRVQWAINQQAKKIERQIPFVLRHAARKGGFPVS